MTDSQFQIHSEKYDCDSNRNDGEKKMTSMAKRTQYIGANKRTKEMVVGVH